MSYIRSIWCRKRVHTRNKLFSLIIACVLLCVASVSSCRENPGINSSQVVSLNTVSVDVIDDAFPTENEPAKRVYETLFFNRITPDSKITQFVVSPYSAWQMSSILYLASSGATKEELATLVAERGVSNRALLEELSKRRQSYLPSLKIAQGFFVSPFIQFHDSFVNELKTTFPDLNLANVPFQVNPDEAVRDINNWIKENTEGRLTEVMTANDVSYDTVCASVSTLLFDAKWASPFNRSMTSFEPFYPIYGDKVMCEMMSQEGFFSYYSHNGWTYVALPYASNTSQKGRFICEIVLPSQQESFYDGFHEEYSEFVTLARQKAELCRMSLSLPKISLKQRVDLKQMMEDLGVKTAFSKHADFSPMTAMPLSLEKVFQETLLRINEEGTEIASATVATMIARSCGPQERPMIQIVVDRPFFVTVRDKESDALHIPPLVFAYVGAIN